MSTDRGFTLIETLVAVLIGTLLVIFAGILGGNLIRHRANADSSSAATSIAQQALELIRAEPVLDPDATACSVPVCASAWPDEINRCPRLCARVYGPFPVNEHGTPAIGGPYQLSWVVTDGQPVALSDVDSKRVVVEVSHENNPLVRSRLQTYLQVSTPRGVIL
jgi:prepilin-type N-terminal cleavage/methylation domain-containing protein